LIDLIIKLTLKGVTKLRSILLRLGSFPIQITLTLLLITEENRVTHYEKVICSLL